MEQFEKGVWIINTPCERCNGTKSKALYLTDSGKQHTWCYKCKTRVVIHEQKPLGELLLGGCDDEFNRGG